MSANSLTKVNGASDGCPKGMNNALFLSDIPSTPSLWNGGSDPDIQFFDENSPTEKVFRGLSSPEILERVDRSSPKSPFFGKIGQNGVIQQFSAILATALKSSRHLVEKTALLLTGPPSAGKTDLAKCLIRGLDLPTIETDGKQITSTNSVFEFVKDTLNEDKLSFPVLGERNGKSLYKLPPSVLFIDEIHGLRPTVMDALLKALESKDCTLVTDDAYVDCTNLLWIGATTERGIILANKPAFDTRFRKIEFDSYSREEIVEIVKLNFPSWEYSECQEIVSKSSYIIREAIQLGQIVESQFELMSLSGRPTRMDAIHKVVEQIGINEHGLNKTQMRVLQLLAKKHPNGATYGHICSSIKKGVEELKQAILPGLMFSADGKKPFVVWNGYTTITEEGLELVKNGN